MEKMKHLLIISVLFVGNNFSEDNFPIKLTCEFGEEILYVNVGSRPETSWIEFHPSSDDKLSANLFHNFKASKKKRIYPRKRFNFFITEEKIELGFPMMAGTQYLSINRLTGGAKTFFFVNKAGQCFKGIKEYAEKKF